MCVCYNYVKLHLIYLRVLRIFDFSLPRPYERSQKQRTEDVLMGVLNSIVKSRIINARRKNSWKGSCHCDTVQDTKKNMPVNFLFIPLGFQCPKII